MDLLTTARFHITVVRTAAIVPANPQLLPEVALVGRSNAGKSTCLNLLCNRRRLAFASRTPGRTQSLNYFAVGPVNAEPIGFLVDTPGYGYAAAGEEARRGWQALAGEYVRRGPPLSAVVLMLDIRRGVTTIDQELIDWLPAPTPLLVVLTKADKLSSLQQSRTEAQVRKHPALLRRTGPVYLQRFSALKRTGLDALRLQVAQWVLQPQGPAIEPPLPPAPGEGADGTPP